MKMWKRKRKGKKIKNKKSQNSIKVGERLEVKWKVKGVAVA